MPRKPTDKAAPSVPDVDKPDAVDNEQQVSRYYYDDACGYEVFDPEDEDKEDDEETKAPSEN